MMDSVVFFRKCILNTFFFSGEPSRNKKFCYEFSRSLLYLSHYVDFDMSKNRLNQMVKNMKYTSDVTSSG